MHSLSISFGSLPVPAQFLFKDEEKAKTVYNTYVDYVVNNAMNGILIGTDDFGQSFAIPFTEIHGILLEDLELGEEARIQRGLSNARGQAKANERAKVDPVLRQAMTQQQRPSMLTPFSNGGFNG